MSKCRINRNFCMTHKCWVAVQNDPTCPMSALTAKVERLTAELAERNRIIEEALASDEAIRAFGLAWGQANARLTLKPGNRRRAGLRAVADVVKAALARGASWRGVHNQDSHIVFQSVEEEQ